MNKKIFECKLFYLDIGLEIDGESFRISSQAIFERASNEDFKSYFIETRFIKFLPNEIRTAQNQTQYFPNLTDLLDEISPYWMIGDPKIIDPAFREIFSEEFNKRKEKAEEICQLIGKNLDDLKKSWIKFL